MHIQCPAIIIRKFKVCCFDLVLRKQHWFDLWWKRNFLPVYGINTHQMWYEIWIAIDLWCKFWSRKPIITGYLWADHVNLPSTPYSCIIIHIIIKSSLHFSHGRGITRCIETYDGFKKNYYIIVLTFKQNKSYHYRDLNTNFSFTCIISIGLTGQVQNQVVSCIVPYISVGWHWSIPLQSDSI